jgi:uncharacterized membrane protein YhhN
LNQTTILLSVLCLGFAAANVLADWKSSWRLALITKIAASTSFLLLGALGLGTSGYGKFVVAALAFSWIGDVLLVSRTRSALIAGIGAFLLAHLAYTAAFSTIPLNVWGFAAGFIAWTSVAVLLILWLWPHLDEQYRIAVAVYSVAIVMMVSFAAATLSLLIAVAACMFAFSDISVARDRFVDHSVSNKIWGIPLYYLAQVLFAVSVRSPIG